MDFLESLDRSLYGKFVCEIINDIAKRTMSVPQNENEVYVLATTRVMRSSLDLLLTPSHMNPMSSNACFSSLYIYIYIYIYK